MERQPLVLLPGLLCDEALFAAQIKALKDVCEPIVMPLTGAESITALANQVLERAPERFAIAGLSMGGYTALAVQRAARERVSRIALLNTSARKDDDATAARRRGLIELSQKGEFKGVTPLLLPLLLPEARLNDKALVDAIMEMAQRVGRDAFVRQQKAIMSRVDSRPYLPRIDAPTLVVSGALDPLTPPELQKEIADAIPGAELEVIPDCGHLSTMETPDAANAALRRWLAREV